LSSRGGQGVSAQIKEHGWQYHLPAEIASGKTLGVSPRLRRCPT
jgi:hypothetical protein